MNIKVYSTETCPYCHKLKDFLNAHKIEFSDVDVSSNPQAVEELIKKSGQMGVPVADIDGEIIVGFDEPQLKEKLNIK